MLPSPNGNKGIGAPLDAPYAFEAGKKWDGSLPASYTKQYLPAVLNSISEDGTTDKQLSCRKCLASMIVSFSTVCYRDLRET